MSTLFSEHSKSGLVLFHFLRCDWFLPLLSEKNINISRPGNRSERFKLTPNYVRDVWVQRELKEKKKLKTRLCGRWILVKLCECVFCGLVRFDWKCSDVSPRVNKVRIISNFVWLTSKAPVNPFMESFTSCIGVSKNDEPLLLWRISFD